MPLNINYFARIFLAVLAFALAACQNYEVDFPVEEDNSPDFFQIEGVFSTDSISLWVFIPDSPVRPSVVANRLPKDDALVTLHRVDFNRVDTLPFQPFSQSYSLGGQFGGDTIYYFNFSRLATVPARSENLVFPPPASDVLVEWDQETQSEDFQILDLSFNKQDASYFYLEGTVIDANDNAPFRRATVGARFEYLFLQQCGFVDDIALAVFSDRCFDENQITVPISYFPYSSSIFRIFGDYVYYDEAPVKKGLLFGTLSQNGYQYMKTQESAGNFFEDYLSGGRVVFSQSNIEDGIGYIRVVNGKYYFWDF